jgi:DNA-binding response OmpR family regulator
MSEVFLLTRGGPVKSLFFIRKQILKRGIQCQIIRSPRSAVRKVKECFSLAPRHIPKLRPVKVAGFKIDPNLHKLYSNGSAGSAGSAINLRKKEYELLQYFVENKNSIVTRNSILENVWGESSNFFTNTVDMHVSSLRKKINHPGREILKTIHGVGYTLQI